MRVLFVIPPMTQLNNPYPSAAYLTGFLRAQGVAAVQEDLALGLVLRLFSPEGLLALKEWIERMPKAQRSARTRGFLKRFAAYHAGIGPAMAFLQGRDTSLAHRIGRRDFLPEGPRFESLEVYIDPEGGDPLAWAFRSKSTRLNSSHNPASRMPSSA
jgi:hypothetical protein